MCGIRPKTKICTACVCVYVGLQMCIAVSMELVRRMLQMLLLHARSMRKCDENCKTNEEELPNVRLRGGGGVRVRVMGT